MFQRGQKVIVIESSAKGGVHPKVGDIGYLDNMYLLPADRLILLDIIFFAYESDIRKDKSRVEKKKLIIDLGMKKDLRYRITKVGVPRMFFHQPVRVCLTSVGYCLPVEAYKYIDTYVFMDHPYPTSLYGIWAKEINKKGKPLFKNLVTIPCGNIASFSSQSDRKYPMEDCSINELLAWIQTMNPIMEAMWITFFEAGASSQVEVIWRNVEGLLKYKHYEDKIVYSISKNFSNESSATRASFITNIRRLGLLNNMLLSCLDVAFFSRLDKLILDFKAVTADEWSRSGIINITSDSNMDNGKKPHSPYSVFLQAVRSIFFRNIIMPGDICRQLEMMRQCFPVSFVPGNNKIIRAEAERFLEVQKAVDSNSSALNRIFDSKLVF